MLNYTHQKRAYFLRSAIFSISNRIDLFPFYPQITQFIKRNPVPIFSSQPHPRFLGSCSSNRISLRSLLGSCQHFSLGYTTSNNSMESNPNAIFSPVHSFFTLILYIYIYIEPNHPLAPFSCLFPRHVVVVGGVRFFHRSIDPYPRFSSRGTFSEGGDWRNGNEWNAAAAAMIVSGGESGTSLRSLLLARNQRCGQPG